jgi:hypothetical protein
VAPAPDDATSAGPSLVELATASAVPASAVAGQAAGPGRQTTVYQTTAAMGRQMRAASATPRQQQDDGPPVSAPTRRRSGRTVLPPSARSRAPTVPAAVATVSAAATPRPSDAVPFAVPPTPESAALAVPRPPAAEPFGATRLRATAPIGRTASQAEPGRRLPPARAVADGADGGARKKQRLSASRGGGAYMFGTLRWTVPTTTAFLGFLCTNNEDARLITAVLGTGSPAGKDQDAIGVAARLARAIPDLAPHFLPRFPAGVVDVLPEMGRAIRSNLATRYKKLAEAWRACRESHEQTGAGQSLRDEACLTFAGVSKTLSSAARARLVPAATRAYDMGYSI